MFISGPKDLLALLEATVSLNDWHSLGLLLGLEKYQLDRIDINKRGIVEDCKKAMMSMWLDTGNATWCALVRALTSSQLVNKKALAKKIAAEHPLR